MHEYRAVRTSTHLYARTPHGPWMLYDLEKNPYQLDNLIESRGPEAIPPEIEQELQGWLESTDDFFGTTEHYMELIDLETGLVREPGKVAPCGAVSSFRAVLFQLARQTGHQHPFAYSLPT